MFFKIRSTRRERGPRASRCIMGYYGFTGVPYMKHRFKSNSPSSTSGVPSLISTLGEMGMQRKTSRFMGLPMLVHHLDLLQLLLDLKNTSLKNNKLKFCSVLTSVCSQWQRYHAVHRLSLACAHANIRLWALITKPTCVDIETHGCRYIFILCHQHGTLFSKNYNTLENNGAFSKMKRNICDTFLR